MSENPTIPQILERLAVVAPEWCIAQENGDFSFNFHGKLNIDPADIDEWIKWELFGAVCDYCLDNHWNWSMPNYIEKSGGTYDFYGPFSSYSFVICRMDETHKRKLPAAVGKSRSPTVAALSALLAALEGRVESGSDWVKEASKKAKEFFDNASDDDIEAALVLAGYNEYCPECNGEGYTPYYSGDCETCEGSGNKPKVIQEDCPECKGSGWEMKMPNNSLPSRKLQLVDCPACQGSGKKQEKDKSGCDICGDDDWDTTEEGFTYCLSCGHAPEDDNCDCATCIAIRHHFKEATE